MKTTEWVLVQSQTDFFFFLVVVVSGVAGGLGFRVRGSRVGEGQGSGRGAGLPGVSTIQICLSL